jgi:hypothetical protein
MRRCSFACYNLAPAGDMDRGPDFVQRELAAIANNLSPDPERRRPKVIGICEAVDRTMPELERFNLVRSTLNRSRANIALYVRDDLEIGAPEWVMHTRTWPRPLHPELGPHEPRATLVVPVENWTVVVSHAPQIGEGIGPARDEWVDIVAGLVSRPGPVLLLSDPNGLGEELVRRVPELRKGGTPIEAVHAHRAKPKRIQTPEIVNGIKMLSDHKKCLMGRAVRT